MRRSLLITGALAFAAMALVAAAGCRAVPIDQTEYGRRIGPSVDETATIALQGATSERAEISIGVGTLKLNGGSSNAMDAEFRYRPRTWKPEVSYSVQPGGVGTLSVRQPRSGGNTAFIEHRNEWDVSLPTSVPLDLDVNLGVGESTVDLTDVDVRTVDLQMGTGEATLDLSGVRTSDVTGDIQAGVGQLTVRVPDNVGVIIEGARDGVGDFQADGFSSQNGTWTNAQYGKSPVTIKLSIQRGVGEVRIVTVPTLQ